MLSPLGTKIAQISKYIVDIESQFLTDRERDCK
jgi:hypothetical protein